MSDSIYIKTKVRLPIAFSDSSEDKDRAIGLTVIERIRELQATGIRSDTINRKIKQEFNESKYHLQERIRIGNNNFYVQAGSEYFEIVNGEVKKIDRVTFDQGRRILVKVVRGPDSKEKFDSEIREVASGLRRKLKRLPNIREVAKAMPSLETSRNPVALLYKHLEGKDISAYGIGKFSGKANIVIKKSFAFAGTRIFLPRQLYKMVQISAEKTPISRETKIDIVDIKHRENRLTLEHIKETDVLRLTYIQPSSKKITADITGINGKTSVTLALNPVFSDFYDTVFSIPLYPSRERLKAVAEHLRNRKFGTYSAQEERHVNFHGRLYLPLFYYTHPGRIRIYRDRESWVRFLVLEDVANPNNIVGYEWRENRIIPLERGSTLKIDNYVSIDSGRKMPLYYLHKSSVFREFDQRLDKSVEVKIATPNDTRLSDIAIGTGRFSFRVRRNVSVISFEGQRSPDNITRDDRSRYPIRIVRSDDKSEIKIGYRNPDVQGEFVVDGLNWEDESPVVLKGPAGYKGKRGYFNLSTIIEMLRQDLLPGIEASNWLLETFSFYEGPEGAGLRNPIRSYKIKETSSGEKVLVEDIFVDPKTFEPWHNAKGLLRTSRGRNSL